MDVMNMDKPDIWFSAIERIPDKHRDVVECYVADLECKIRTLESYITNILLPSKHITIKLEVE